MASRKWLVSPDDCDFASIPEPVIRKLLTPEPGETVRGTKCKPGDDFNANGPSWDQIITAWTYVGNDGKQTSYWRRPGKSDGISATTGYLHTQDGYELLYVFSSNAAPLEAGKAYTKFAAYAYLNHGGDFKAAAADLREQGYGKPAKGPGKPSAATELIAMLADDPQVELFHSLGGDAYATVPVSGHRETYRLDTKSIKNYLSHRYYQDLGKAASSKAVSDALGVITSMAMNDGPELDVCLRVGGNTEKIYIDRGAPEWDAVEISADGFKIVSDPPVKFWRPKGMLTLPIPSARGSLADLRSFVTLGDEQFVLMVGTLLSYLRPNSPYPITVITGEQGTAKSTTADILRKLIDPKFVQRQAEPKDLKQLMVAARNNWIVSYDNLSNVGQWLSDGLCRLATGGGLSDRELYTDGDEFVINAKRPVIINSIVDVATKSDLVDRAVMLDLTPIPQDKRRHEDEFWKEFEAKRPMILGALYGAVSFALRELPNVSLSDKPRMADFAKWVTAAEPALGLSDGQFLEIYLGNQKQASATMLESTVAQAVTRLLDKESSWEGQPAELYTLLSASLGDAGRGQGQWPGSAAKLTGELCRLAPALRTAGYDYCKKKSNGRNPSCAQKINARRRSARTKHSGLQFGA